MSERLVSSGTEFMPALLMRKSILEPCPSVAVTLSANEDMDLRSDVSHCRMWILEPSASSDSKELRSEVSERVEQIMVLEPSRAICVTSLH